MSKMAFGIDFGTSNSAIAMATVSGEVRIARWKLPEMLCVSDDPRQDANFSETVPTVLFSPEYAAELQIGHSAIAQYLFTGLEGRFIQSMKSFLPQSSFSGTIMRGRHYTIEELVAAFLRRLLEGAETILGVGIAGERVVMGRPARFSLDPEEDQLAEQRLRSAARLAGLGEVELLIEPFAAALAYEATLTHDENVLVVDLGGGTSDFTLMRVGPSYRGDRNRDANILSSGGIPVAGDCFDGEIVEARLFHAFGFGSSYLALTDRTLVPHWIFQKLKRWNQVSFLKNKKYLEFLREVLRTSDRPEQIGALVRLIDEDMSYLLFRAVERSKRELASLSKSRTTISDPENALPVRATLTRDQFRTATRPLVDSIRTMALSVVSEGGVKPDGVDAVFMTGGTSLVPEVRAAFADLFGADRLRQRSTFTSVVDGLSRAAGTR